MKKVMMIFALAIGGLSIGCIKNIENTDEGTLITFRDSTGYYIEK